MATLFLDPGLLRWRAVLETADLTPDRAGGAMPAWREVRELSVHVEPVAAKAEERFDQEMATITHRVICRGAEEVQRGLAFRLGDRRLLIRAVHDPEETGRFLVCRCDEEA